MQVATPTLYEAWGFGSMKRYTPNPAQIAALKASLKRGQKLVDAEKAKNPALK